MVLMGSGKYRSRTLEIAGSCVPQPVLHRPPPTGVGWLGDWGCRGEKVLQNSIKESGKVRGF